MAERQSSNRDAAAWLSGLAERLVRVSWQRAPLVLAVIVLLTGVFGWFAATHLGTDTRTSELLDPDLPWRQEEAVLNAAFPQHDHILLVVLDGATPEIAQSATDELAAALRREPRLYPDVSAPEDSEFFRRDALLFLDTGELRNVADQLIAAQGLIAMLAADPSVNGLFAALNLALEGAGGGDVAIAKLDAPLGAITDVVSAGIDGETRYLSWGALFSGRAPEPRELRHLIAIKPALDYASLAAGGDAQGGVRRIANDLGLVPANGVTIRFTGDVALDDEEFSSVERGVGFATAASFALVFVILYLAMGRARPVAANLVVLLVGLVWTVAFAAASVGKLNLVSAAFIVMFVGIAVDFGIQFSVRIREERRLGADRADAASRAGRNVGGALLLAAVTNAIGFLAFAPTDYRGVSELGIIAGAGMIIAFLLNLTALPAMLRVLGALPPPAAQGFALLAVADEKILTHRRYILWAAVGMGLLAIALLPRLHFDFNPLNLKDPSAESVQALRSLMSDGVVTASTMEVLAPSLEQAASLASKLEALPEVDHVLSLESFVPAEQQQKLAIIEDAAQFFDLPFDMTADAGAGAADRTKTTATIRETIGRLRAIEAQAPATAPRFGKLADLLERLLAEGDAGMARVDAGLLRGLKTRLSAVGQMLDPMPITLGAIPADVARDWRTADGRYRIEIYPKGDVNDNATLVRFVAAVRSAVPDAVGEAYFIQQAGDVVWRAFREAFLYSLVGVCLALYVVLRRVRDVLLVIGPLLFSALMTLGTMVLIGVPINFANVIGLPLLIGIGAAFNIYFVMRWRAGRANPLRSSTARAVLFSALTTLAAVSSLAISPHAGTASMGILLTLCLGYALLSALILLPALLGTPPGRVTGE